jgi:hypothetical protein
MTCDIPSPSFVNTLDVRELKALVLLMIWTGIEGASTHLLFKDQQLPNGIDVTSKGVSPKTSPGRGSTIFGAISNACMRKVSQRMKNLKRWYDGRLDEITPDLPLIPFKADQ